MRVALYARVSTVGKGQDHENQLSVMRDWANKEGHELVDAFIDTVSGSGKLRRPAFERMMVDAEAGKFEMLIFWSLDRLSREGVYTTLQHLKRLDDAKVCYRSHTEPYLDSCGLFKDAVLAILAVIAKQERIRISERVKAGLEVAKSKGRVGGRPKVEMDIQLKERLTLFRAEGNTITDIAARVGMSKSQVHRILHAEVCA